MGDSKIEWTDKTWNPVRGCQLVSPGCTNCYAMKFAHRFSGNGKPYEGLTKLGGKGPMWTGIARPAPEMLDQPLRWKKPARVFVNSMSDLFHEDIPNEYIAAVFGVMAACPRHTFQILTKRAARLPEWIAWMDANSCTSPGCTRQRVQCNVAFAGQQAARLVGYRDAFVGLSMFVQWPLPNVWLGVSVEDQKSANERIVPLLRTPAVVRFLSCEPLLEAVDLTNVRHDFKRPGHRDVECFHDILRGSPFTGLTHKTRIDWVIVGGESGNGSRPMRLKWARDLIEQCRSAGVKVFFKQAGEKPMISKKTHQTLSLRVLNDNATKTAPEGFVILKVSGKGGEITELPGGPDAWPREFPEAAR